MTPVFLLDLPQVMGINVAYSLHTQIKRCTYIVIGRHFESKPSHFKDDTFFVGQENHVDSQGK